MRTTWLILLLMVLAGAGMYYFATRKKPLAPYDTITIHDTPDSIKNRIKLFAAFNPTEITYRDSAWYRQDSIPLEQVPLDSAVSVFDKKYKSVTFYLDYDHAWFYDVEVNKPSEDISYIIKFAINKLKDTLQAAGTIDDQQHDQLRFNGPMMKMYQSFILTYNNKLPPVQDSTQEAPTGPQPAKTITVLRN
jgi:hypothetical protein